MQKENRSWRVLITADDPALVEVLVHYLQAAGYEVATSRDRLEVIKRLTVFQPDLIIADFRMPGLPGPQLVSQLRILLPESVPVVFLVEAKSREDRIHAYQSSGNAVVTKPVDRDELLAILTGIVNHLKDLRSGMIGPQRTETLHEQATDLTLAEKRVAIALAQGLSNKEIAKQFGISLRTVENHISRILFKKGFKNRVEIARYVYETRLREAE